MISLLDANVLIALFDACHVHHLQAQQWLTAHRSNGWATCPLTQNACIRVIGQANYPNRMPIAEITRRLRQATAAVDHHFWPDAISFCDGVRFAHHLVLTPKYLTDLYLLALAMENGGRLVTFDRNIPTHAVPSEEAKNLVVL